MVQHRFGSIVRRAISVAAALIFSAAFSAACYAVPIAFEHSAIPSEAGSVVIPFRHHITVSAAELAAMQTGQSFSVSIPGHGSAFEIVYDRTEVSSLGPATWIGHLQGNGDYGTVITNFGSHSVGQIGTPEGVFHIETVDGVTSLIDLERQGYKKPAYKNDAMSVRGKAAAIDDKAATPIPELSGAAPAAGGNSVIDVLVIYNPSFVTATGNAQSTIASVIATANQAMVDSNVPITFRVVATQQLNMSDADDNDVLLQKITYPSDPRLVSSSFADPVYTGLPALRTQYGADLVVAMRQFTSAQTSCGIAWLLDQLGSGSSQAVSESAPDAYAVVSYGQYQVGNTNEYYLCDQVTTAHEMGHNLGLAHDYAHAQLSDGTYPAAFPYSYGYGFVNRFATIMAANYISPATVVAKYSSPNLTCLGSPCGVAGNTAGVSANNAAALVITGPLGAQFMPTQVTTVTTTPATGYWWNPSQGGRGFNIEQRGNNLFMATFLYNQSGSATWYGLGPGPISNGTYSGLLTTYAGGQTLTGSYKPAGVVATAGNFSVTFSSATQGTITWPGGTLPIQRYDFGPGGSAATQPAGTPQAGWWWAPTQGGRGFAIEIQGNMMFLAGYMYDSAGNAIWYASGPAPMNGMIYQGTWSQLANGQTLTGAYQPATVLNADVGPVTIIFTSTTTGSMTFPNGLTVSIERYAF
jgi:hypothetical protein